MAKRRSRPSLEDRLAALSELAGEADEEKLHQALRAAVADKSPHLVARAARVVEENGLETLAPALCDAFATRMKDAITRDKGCVAKTAIAQALATLEVAADEVYLQGVRHVQMEPVYGRPVDTAVDLRVISAYALSNAGHSEIMAVLVDLLADPESAARQGAARALANAGRLEAESVLRLKARVGDEDPEVLSACLAALLHLAPERYLTFAISFLEATEQATIEAAALALGESRLEGAVAPIWRAYQHCFFRGRATLLLALALTRREAAFDHLLTLVTEAAPIQATQALEALAIHRHDEKIRHRVAAALAARPDGGNGLRNRFD